MAFSDELGLTLGQRFVCFFVSIATILGTGILALPVKLDECGFAPFTLTFTISLFAQCFTACLMVELLQRAVVLSEKEEIASAAGMSNTSNSVASPTSASTADDEGAEEGEGIEVEVITGGSRHAPSLHRLASLFLRSRSAFMLFNGCAMVHFTSLLIGYALAWSKAFCQLASCEDQVVIAPFVILFSLGLVVFARQLQPLVSALTSFKCVMLIVMVAVVGYIGVERTRVESTEDWTAAGAPFLMGTIALGGVVNVMPVLFEVVPQTRRAMQQFRSAVIAGVVVCYVLNLLWAYFILRVVPQRSQGICIQDSPIGNVTLQCANDHDEISTEPVVDVIRMQFRPLLWLADLVASFILLSITVSYLTMGNAMKHLLDGFVLAQSKPDAQRLLMKLFHSPLVLRVSLYVVCFGFIMIVALLNPQGFLFVLEVFTSLSLNIEGGVFIGYMFMVSRQGKALGGIPLELHPPFSYFWVFSCLFFLAAVFYDIVTVVLNLLGMRNGAIVLSIAAVLWLAGMAWSFYGNRRNRVRGAFYTEIIAMDDVGGLSADGQSLPWDDTDDEDTMVIGYPVAPQQGHSGRAHGDVPGGFAAAASKDVGAGNESNT